MSALVPLRVLICDRDTKWSAPVRARLEEAGTRVVQTPYRGAQREYLRRTVRALDQRGVPGPGDPVRERHLRRAIAEYVEHYHREPNHQGIENALIERAPTTNAVGRIRRRSRLGGVLNYYQRAA